jgi:hypothetical protein
MAMVDFLLGSITDNLTVSLALVIGMGTLVGMSMGLVPREPEAEADEPPAVDTPATAPYGRRTAW